jgi:hypothetical protein
MKQKELERYHLEQAIRTGKLGWTIAEEGEAPDFTINSPAGLFGLEIVTVYRGGGAEGVGRRGVRKFAKGAWSKKREEMRNADLQRLRRTYEALGGPALTVKVLGNIHSQDFKEIPRRLDEIGAGRLELGDQIRIDLPCVTVHATRSFTPVWIMIEDVVGWVYSEPRKEVEAAISAKATKLPAYQQRVGTDVRLLIIAEDRFNSGKLRPHDGMLFDGHGFKEVYFFNSPSGPFQTLNITLASDGHMDL